MKEHIVIWSDKCLTCLRFRKRPTKQGQVPVIPTNYHPWHEIMVDCEGQSNPPAYLGHTYILSYYCCLCHGVLLEPMKGLSAESVRRAFARCVFRSGVLPRIVRSDGGPEFKNYLMREFAARIGVRWRSCPGYRRRGSEFWLLTRLTTTVGYTFIWESYTLCGLPHWAASRRLRGGTSSGR